MDNRTVKTVGQTIRLLRLIPGFPAILADALAAIAVEILEGRPDSAAKLAAEAATARQRETAAGYAAQRSSRATSARARH